MPLNTSLVAIVTTSGNSLSLEAIRPVERTHEEAQHDADRPDYPERQRRLQHDDRRDAATDGHLITDGEVNAAADHYKADAHTRDDYIGALSDEIIEIAG